MHAFRLADGKSAWSFATRGRVDSCPVVVGSRVFVGSADGRLYALDLKTGESVWTYEAGGQFVASPAVAAERLVIGNQDGTLYCFGRKIRGMATPKPKQNRSRQLLHLELSAVLAVDAPSNCRPCAGRRRAAARAARLQ